MPCNLELIHFPSETEFACIKKVWDSKLNLCWCIAQNNKKYKESECCETAPLDNIEIEEIKRLLDIAIAMPTLKVCLAEVVRAAAKMPSQRWQLWGSLADAQKEVLNTDPINPRVEVTLR